MRQWWAVSELKRLLPPDCSGNMHVSSLAGVAMYILDVVSNFFLIFPSREWNVADISFMIPGVGLGVSGAALGTAAAEAVVAGN